MKNGGFYQKASELYEKGYYVIDIPIGGKMPVRKEWPKIRMNEADISVLNAQKYDPGVGIITGQVTESGYSIIAIDIDIRVGETVEQVIQIFNEIVGISPVRIGNPPKSLMIYKYKGERKKQVTGADSDHNRIEILGTGQQFVAYHTHPDTNKEYWWDREIPSIDELVEINDEQIDECISFWYSICPEAKQEKKVRIDADGNEHYIGKSIPEMVIDILAGNNLHDSLVGLSQQWHYDGLEDENIIRDLRSYMNKSAAKGEARWQSRYDDIPRIVSGARDKDEGIDISDIDIDEEEKRLTIPWPPGLMGELCDDAYSMADYQYREIAVVSTIGLIAGVAGRKFNISRTGLNVYMTLIMKTGMGKDFINKWIYQTLMELNPMDGNAASFCSTGRFTGPLGLAKSLLNARCQIAMFTEAGLLLQSQAGDNTGLCRMLLSIYGRSGAHQYSMAEAYSKDENSIPGMRAPCLSYINEATPDTLLKAFRERNSIDSGELPRQSIFRVSDVKPYLNVHAGSHTIRDACKQKLGHLFRKCSAFQSENDPKAHDITCSPDIMQDMQDFSNKMTDIQNYDGDPNRQAMASRAYLKALKFAALATVMNRDSVEMQWEEWNWGKSMVEYELATIESFFSGGGFGNIIEDLTKRVVAPAIVKIIRGDYKARRQQSDINDARLGVFPKAALVLTLKNNRELNEYTDDTKNRSRPVSGLDKVLTYMLDTGYIERHEWGTRNSTVDGKVDRRHNKNSGKYRVTEMFRTLFGL
jgi:hypothetical protein